MDYKEIKALFLKLMSDEEFKNKYYHSFLDRFVYSNASLDRELTKDEKLKVISNLMNAFNTFMHLPREKMSPFDIKDAGDLVNDGEHHGFRRINVSAGKYAKGWEPVPPTAILYNLYSLIDCYYNIWNERDEYEKEADFHISFMRIHPFEDGNKRTGRLLMNANLVREGLPPIIIDEDEKEKYYEFINNRDIKGFTSFLRRKSIHELGNIISFYKAIYNIPITDSLLEDNRKEALK